MTPRWRIGTTMLHRRKLLRRNRTIPWLWLKFPGNRVPFSTKNIKVFLCVALVKNLMASRCWFSRCSLVWSRSLDARKRSADQFYMKHINLIYGIRIMSAYPAPLCTRLCSFACSYVCICAVCASCMLRVCGCFVCMCGWACSSMGRP